MSGQPVNEQIWQCNSCGHEQPYGNGKCERCGVDLTIYGHPVTANGIKPIPKKNSKTAIVISIIAAVVIAVSAITAALIANLGSGKPEPVGGDDTTVGAPSSGDRDTARPDNTEPAADPPVTEPPKTEPSVTNPPQTEPPADPFVVTGVTFSIPDALYKKNSEGGYAELFVGQSVECKLEYTYTGSRDKDPSISIISSDPGILSAEGLTVTANAASTGGYVTLTATVDGVTVTQRVYVNSSKVSPEILSITPLSVMISENEPTTVEIVVVGTVPDDAEYAWSFSALGIDGVSGSWGPSEYFNHLDAGYDIYRTVITLTVDPTLIEPCNDVLAWIAIFRDFNNDGQCDPYSEIADYCYVRYTK